MGFDLIARATASAARTDADSALARITTVDLFANLSSRTIAPSVTCVHTSGHAAGTAGAGTYASDALATPALATAYPAFCKATANGRYFRLIAVNGAITVEQGGAVGIVGVNDQPAFQATLDYANATGVRTVQLTLPAYELWAPQRTATGLDLTDDGHLVALKGSVTLEGVGLRPVLTRKGFGGVVPSDSLSSVQQVPVSGNYWRGGGIYWSNNSAGINQNTVVILRNFVLDGGLERTADHSPIYPPGTLTGWDITDKGIWIQDVRSGTLVMEHVTIKRFRGEIIYFAGIKDATSTNTLIMDHCHVHTTCGDVLNVQGGERYIANSRFGNGFQAGEELGRGGGRYSNCEFYDCVSIGFQGGPDIGFTPGNYFVSTRQATVAPFIELDNCTFRNCGNVLVGSWLRGNIRTVDTNVYADSSTGYMQDISLTIDAWADQNNFNIGFNLRGPQTLTQQISGLPAGTYFDRPRSINVKVTAQRTAVAAANGRSLASVFAFSGYVDATSCMLEAGPSIAQRVTGSAGGLQPTLPFIVRSRFDTTNLLRGGLVQAIAVNTAISPLHIDYALDPSTAGPWDITFGTAVEFAHEQEVTFTFYDFGTEDRRVRFPVGGANLKVPCGLVLSRKNEFVTFRYNKYLGTGTWVAVAHNVFRLTGSIAYDAPVIAAGASTTTNVTVAGAQFGDKVEDIALGLDAAGLTITGYVSAPNTVTVVLANLTGGAVDLASTTLAVEVVKR